MKICLKCGAVSEYVENISDALVNTSTLLLNDMAEPHIGHDEYVVDIDEEIAWDIYQLNKHGFKTMFCCAGHMYDGNYLTFYVAFDKTYKEIRDYFKKHKSLHIMLEKDELNECHHNTIHIIRPSINPRDDDYCWCNIEEHDPDNLDLYRRRHQDMLDDLRAMVIEICNIGKGE